MEERIPDYYRRRGEGFGDRRRGDDTRVVLMSEFDKDAADVDAQAFEQRVS